MEHRAGRRVWMGVMSLLGLLVVAASTASVDPWRNPGTSGPATVPTPDASEGGAVTSGDASVSSGTGVWRVVVLVVLVVVVLALLRSNRGRSHVGGVLRRHRPWRQLSSAPDAPLAPESVHGPDRELDSARAALLGGQAKDGIVACWMRLERSGFDAGIPRLSAETAEEYKQRMVRAAAIDSTPIGDLADLYREARFSGHAMTERDRDRARHALQRIARELPGSINPESSRR